MQHKQVPDVHLALITSPRYSDCIQEALIVKRFKKDYNFLKTSLFLCTLLEKARGP